MELTSEIIRYLLIGFGSGVFVGVLVTIGYAKYYINKTEIFATLFACLWIFTVITGMEVTQYFHIMGLISSTHIIGERAIKNFINVILELKGVKK